ncbi:MAG TPA: formylmethanofuran dehydrogenase subunit E family protein [Thermoguttaceae bacterium]|nr:formylmethanofuran dehydrogenase subunit E family protein [Thermoguttaceae bacterium]
MVKKLLLWFFAVPVLGLQGVFFLSLMEGPEVKVELPKPHYQPKDTDPSWLAQAAQFHGHLGPWAVSGIRFGAAGRRAVGAQGYFDLEVRCQGPLERPPRACFLDGLQVGTGATMGKRNIHWEAGEELVVWVKNTRTGQTAEVRPTQAFWELLTAAKTKSKPSGAAEDHEADDHDHDHPAAKHEHDKGRGVGPGQSAASKAADASPSDATKGDRGSADSGQQQEAAENPVETAARQIAAMAEGKILTIKILPAP